MKTFLRATAGYEEPHTCPAAYVKTACNRRTVVWSSGKYMNAHTFSHMLETSFIQACVHVCGCNCACVPASGGQHIGQDFNNAAETEWDNRNWIELHRIILPCTHYTNNYNYTNNKSNNNEAGSKQLICICVICTYICVYHMCVYIHRRGAHELVCTLNGNVVGICGFHSACNNNRFIFCF